MLRDPSVQLLRQSFGNLDVGGKHGHNRSTDVGALRQMKRDESVT